MTSVATLQVEPRGLADAAAVGSVAAVASVAAPQGQPDLAALVARLEGDWQLEETDKAYWIGYTDDMRAIAKHGDAALAPLAALASRKDAKPWTRYGALLTIHYIGIEGHVAGRYVEAFRRQTARDVLLELLALPELQLETLTLLIRDPWPTDLPRIFEVLEVAGPHQWAFVKALQRYALVGAPVHQPLPPDLAGVQYDLPGSAKEESNGHTLVSYTGSMAQLKVRWLEALARLPQVVIEDALLREPPPNDNQGWISGSWTPALWNVLDQLTSCDYLDFGDKLDYFIEGGKVHLCTTETAAARWLAWYRSQPPGPLPADRAGDVAFACYDGGVERVSAYLDACPEGLSARGYEKMTPLHIAAKSGLGDIVELLLQRGADLHAMDEYGQTALHRAAAEDRGDIIDQLVRAGSTLELGDKKGITPLALAAREGHTDAIQRLIHAGAHVDIFVAAATGQTELVREALRANSTLARARDGAGRTPLHFAARFGHLEIVELLLAAGASPDVAATVERHTPLHEAAVRGHVEVTRALVRAGANIHAVGGLWGRHTPLQEAVREGHEEAARALLDAGARVNDNFEDQGRPALQWACCYERLELVKLLLERGADPNQVDKNGTTALWWAIDARHNKAIEALLREHGAVAPAPPHYGR